MDPARLLVLFVLHVGALARGHHAVRLRTALDAVEVYLARFEPARLARGELTALHAIADALLLMRLARVVTRRARRRGTRHHHQGQTETGQNRRLLHDSLLKGRKFGAHARTTGRARWR